MRCAVLLSLLVASASALVVTPQSRAVRPAAAAAAAPVMMAGKGKDAASMGGQVEKFERGDDYLFFQSPAPYTQFQEGLPDFFSAENFQDLEISPLQIIFTGTGVAALAATIFLLVSS